MVSCLSSYRHWWTALSLRAVKVASVMSIPTAASTKSEPGRYAGAIVCVALFAQDLVIVVLVVQTLQHC